jgi:hypothetical protein
VAGLEESMSSALSGISRILSALSDMKRSISADGGPQQADAMNVSVPTVGPVAGTSTPPEWQVRARTQPDGEFTVGTGSQSKSQKESSAHTDAARGASFSHPLVVQVPSSSDSEENNTPCRRVSTMEDSPAKRVHLNPRMRVAPVEVRLGQSRPVNEKGPPSGGPAGSPQSRAYKYKNPPGYEDARDFGTTSEPRYKVPELQPRKKNVSVPRWLLILI